MLGIILGSIINLCRFNIEGEKRSTDNFDVGN